ncbi:unnamed protein product, partial [Closterium sp. NIES-53]
TTEQEQEDEQPPAVRQQGVQREEEPQVQRVVNYSGSPPQPSPCAMQQIPPATHWLASKNDPTPPSGRDRDLPFSHRNRHGEQAIPPKIGDAKRNRDGASTGRRTRRSRHHRRRRSRCMSGRHHRGRNRRRSGRHNGRRNRRRSGRHNGRRNRRWSWRKGRRTSRRRRGRTSWRRSGRTSRPHGVQRSGRRGGRGHRLHDRT